MLYIAFLRGINVSGHFIKMDYLRSLFSEMGLTNVRSYIQSGNIFFETNITNRDELGRTISLHLHRTLGYEVAVSLRTVTELEAIIAIDPFRYVTVTPDMRLCIVFTEQTIPSTIELPLLSPRNDMQVIHVTKHEAFVIWYLINGRPPSAKSFQEKILGPNATTRYFHTTIKILEAARKGDES